MRKVLIILLALVFVSLMAGVALANDPSTTSSDNFTYTESSTATPPGSGYNPATPSTLPQGGAYGASRWSYKDNHDSAAKLEGSYRAYQNQTNQLYDWDSTKRDSGPHGGYDTTSNKCKTCHAVHRATGTFALMRVDTPDEACDYCHLGDHRHSVVDAYWGANTIYPSNGHTIGAGEEIPDSSVWQWEENQTVTGGDGKTFTVRARRYNPNKNKIMRWVVHAGSWYRVGPTLLRCQSCHQPHNAYRQVWKPMKSDGTGQWTGGYKLLRNSPSGGIASTDATTSAMRLNPGATTDTHGSSADIRLKVVERATVDVDPADVPFNDLSNNTAGDSPYAGGVNRTGYTVYRYSTPNTTDPTIFKKVPVYETSMSFFCADCHNLNIAGKDKVDTNLGVGKYGQGMLGDRSHAVPMMISANKTVTSSGFHCYTCHNNDMPRVNTLTSVTLQGVTVAVNKDCAACHVTPANYAKFKQTYRQFQGVNGGPSLSDWPHSGPSNGYKLLNSIGPQPGDTWDAADTAAGEATPQDVRQPYTGGADKIDTICLICHGAQGSRSIGYDK